MQGGIVTFRADASAIQAIKPSDIYSWPGPDVHLMGQLERTGIAVRSSSRRTDPDENGWLVQEITKRLPGRIDSAATMFGLASALRRAEAAHGEHEKRTGQRDANWPDWYATYMVAEQAGTELSQ